MKAALTQNEFLYQVYLPIGIWLLLVLGFFILLLKKYTFGHWTKDNSNPFEGETFDMPRGTFRGILTLTLLFVAVILEMVTVRIPGYEEEIHEFMVAFQMMIAFYFGAKVMHHVTSADRAKAEIKASGPLGTATSFAPDASMTSASTGVNSGSATTTQDIPDLSGMPGGDFNMKSAVG